MNHIASRGFRHSFQRRWRQLRFEQFERRNLLTAILPAYVDGEFTFGDPSLDAPYGLENTFALASNPTASKTIYLDFDGHHSVNNTWRHNIVFPAFNRTGSPDNFANSELVEIQKQFQTVAEDFMPFDVNVTTIEPGAEALRNTGGDDTEWGIRVLNTQATDGFGNGIGGVAYLNSFSWNSDTPVFTFNKGVRNGGMTNSHEVGHALGLRHDGIGSRSYHPGDSSGDLGWGPILGAPFGRRITQWSNGDYVDSTNTEDDLAIIANRRNGFGYRSDDHGDDLSAATSLTLVNESQLSGWGVVEQTSDVDVFSFQTGAGDVQLNIEAFADNPNLDIKATLLDAAGNEVAVSNPLDSTDAGFNVNLPAGNYFVSIDGVGLDGRYSEYGSLGFYSITGTGVFESESVIGEAGTIDRIDHQWQTVTLDNSYDDPAIVFGSLSYNGSDEAAIRVRNVTATSFEVRVQEWLNLDGWHTAESVSYVVVESGVHTLSDGTTLAAGVQSGIDHRWGTVDFGHTFDATPVILSQASSFLGGDTIVTRQRNATSTGFQVKVQEEEARGWHVGEDVSWIAVDAGTGSLGDNLYEVFQTSNSVTHRDRAISFSSDFTSSPVFIAGMQTTDGGDTAGIRHKNLSALGATIWVDEERSRDSETRHTTEVVGVFAMEAGNIVANTAGAPASSTGSDGQGGFATGESSGSGAAGGAVPMQTRSGIDGTLGEGVFLESGHPSGQDCHHTDQGEHEHAGHDHGDPLHHQGDPHDPECGCAECQGMAAVGRSAGKQVSVPILEMKDSTESTERSEDSVSQDALREDLANQTWHPFSPAEGTSYVTEEDALFVRDDATADEFFADYEASSELGTPITHALRIASLQL